MNLTFKYRLLPTKAQHAALSKLLDDQRQLYNGALEERIGYYRRTNKNRSYIDQTKALTEWRKSDAEARETPFNIQRWTLKRLDNAYSAFFRRLRANRSKAGFPRFRGKGWWKSFGFNEFRGVSFDGKRIRFASMPSGIRVHLHRSMPLGCRIRGCVFTADPKGWTVCFQVEIPDIEAVPQNRCVGIDLGLKVFAYQSDGSSIPNPKIAKHAERKMRITQRALSRCKKGSSGRRKAKIQLSRLHGKITDTRRTWLHQQSAQIARRYGTIIVENLTVANLIKNPNMANSIADASWATFIDMIAYKAEKAGGRLVRINPKYTSQKCSGCDGFVQKQLSMRVHACPSCGLVLDRDHNAALNILRAVVGPGQLNVAHQGVRAAGNLKEILN